MPSFLRNFGDRVGKKGVRRLVLMLVGGVALLLVSAYFAGGGGDAAPLVPDRTQGLLDLHVVEEGGDAEYDLARRLEGILSEIKGAGDVRVMLTFGGRAHVFAQDTTHSTSATTEEDGEGGIRNVETTNASVTHVMVRNADGSEAPLLLAEIAPAIQGAIVVAQGAGDIAVAAALVRAAHTALGIAPHLVQVFQKR